MLVQRKLLEVAAGRITRLQLNMPPRHGKTELVIWFVVWYLLQFPDRKVIYLTHSAGLAREFGERVRDTIAEHGGWLASLRISKDRASSNHWKLCDEHGRATGGGLLCRGVNARLHGYGASLIILDDIFGSVLEAISPAIRERNWRVINGSIGTRLSANGAVINIGTPVHSDDLFGRFQRAEDLGGDKWERIRLPAIGTDGAALWPAMFPLPALEAKRDHLKASGEFRDWLSQYVLTPPSGDGISEWPEEYFNPDVIWQEAPAANRQRRIVAIDSSKGTKTGDFQAITCSDFLEDGTFHVPDADLVRLDDHRLMKHLQVLLEKWAPVDCCVVETNAAGYTIFERLAHTRVRNQYVKVLGRNHNSKDHKETRISVRLTPLLARGHLRFRKCPGTIQIIDQARVFPNGDYDDGIDSLELGLELHGQLCLPHVMRMVKYTFPQVGVAR